MITCKKCGNDKPEDQMKPRNGVPSKVCLECDEKAKRERDRLKKILKDARKESVRSRKKKGSKRAKRAPREVRVEKPEVLELTQPAGGHGFTAKISEGALLITQKNPDAPDDNIVPERHEAKALFDKFGLWIVGE